MLTLYHDWDSFASYKVRMALAERAIEAREELVLLGRFEHLKPGYLALNPNGVVPTLVHDGWAVVESAVILEYLEDAFPDAPGLRPGEPRACAAVRYWMAYSAGAIHQAIRPPTFQLMIKTRLANVRQKDIAKMVQDHPMPERAAAYIEWASGPVDYDAVLDAAAQLESVVSRIEAALKDKDWLADTDLTLADIAVAPLVDRIEHLQMDFLWEGRDRTQDWIRRIKDRPSYLRSAPPAKARLPGPSPDVASRTEHLWRQRRRAATK